MQGATGRQQVSTVEFRVLGPLEVVVGGRAVNLGGPRQRAVLAVLLLNANRVVPIDRLADAVWDGRPPPGATGTLQAYISNLRRLLEPGRSAREPPRLLLSRASGYVLQVGADEVDSERFELQAKEGRRLLAAQQPEAARNVLVSAVELWRGPALADFAYESFAHSESVRLEELRTVAIEDLIDAELAAGAEAEVVPRLEALVIQQPARERLWRQLMLAQYRAGRQRDALATFQRARSVLKEELGLDPGPALCKLEQAILNQEPGLLLASARLATHAPNEPAHSPSSSAVRAAAPRLGPTLVGREKELALLRLALDEAAAGAGGLVLLAGAAGIGKTRLAQELEAHARQQDVTLAWGRAYEGTGAPPFWSWVQVLRRVVSGLDVESMEPALTELTSLVPELAPRLSPAKEMASLPPEMERFRIIDAATRVLLECSQRRAVVVILDDLHWADPTSLQLLEFLVPFIADARVLVIGTYRDRELSSSLRDALGTLARQTNVRRIVVSPLDRGDVESLVRETLGGPADAELLDVLHARTQGNPFYVSELLQLVKSGELSSARDEVPAGVRDVIHRRVSHLPTEAQELLATAAVIGREFDVDDLVAALGREHRDVLAWLELVLATGMVEPYDR